MPVRHARARAFRSISLGVLARGVVVLLVGLLALAPASAAAASSDPVQRRREVQRRKAEVAAQVDALKASDAQLAQALDTLAANVRQHEAELASARQAADIATQQMISARAAQEATSQRLAALRSSLRASAVDTYVAGAGAASMPKVPSGSSAAETARNEALAQFVASRGSDVADQMAVAEQDLKAARTQAEAAQAKAVERRRAAESSLRQLAGARDEQEKLSAAVNDRLEAALGEAASLSALDSQLAADIQRRQDELARRVALSAASGARASRSAATSVGGISLTTVRGITVNSQIANQLDAMLGAAEADGIVYGGRGYRSPDDQVATRRANCGTSDYDVYQKPASECSPPTARPGTSMHEQGLAIDFTYGGSVITSRDSPGYQWLARNASRFGFSNLPSEAWHWSINGR